MYPEVPDTGVSTQGLSPYASQEVLALEGLDPIAHSIQLWLGQGNAHESVKEEEQC